MAASKQTPEVKAAIVESVRAGNYAKHAAGAVGITEQTLYSWINADDEFASAIQRARDEATNEHIQNIRNASQGDWKASAWYLARTRQGDFIERSATEVTGANGGPVEVTQVPTSAERAAELAAILKSAGAL